MQLPPHLIDIPVENIDKQNDFWTITKDNEVVFPRWDKYKFSKIWLDLFKSKSKLILVNLARGGGKSHNIAMWVVNKAFELYEIVKRSGRRYTGPQVHLMIIFPSEENAKAIISMLRELIPPIPGFAPDGEKNYRVRQNSSDCDFRLFGDNELLISVVSGGISAQGLRGKSADIVWIDESFKVKRSDFIDVILPIADRPGRPEEGGYLVASSTPDDDNISLEQWWDEACDEADPESDNTGYFSSFDLIEGAFTANPSLSEERFKRILAQYQINPLKWQRERLAVRGLKTGLGKNEDGSVGNVWLQQQVSHCYYIDKPEVHPGNMLIAVDLAFGAIDKLAIAYYDQISRSVVDLEVYYPSEQNKLGIVPKNYEQGIIRLFEDIGRRYPGATIIYDANSESSRPVEHLIPKHIRTIGIKKNNHVKNGLVQSLITLMQTTSSTGEPIGIKYPDPDAPWLTTEQRKAFGLLYHEMLNYQREAYITRDGNEKIRYTKPMIAGKYSDDAIDAILLLMASVKPPINNNKTVYKRKMSRGW